MLFLLIKYAHDIIKQYVIIFILLPFLEKLFYQMELVYLHCYLMKSMDNE